MSLWLFKVFFDGILSEVKARVLESFESCKGNEL